MEDLGDRVVAEEVEERREVEALGQRVDKDRFLLGGSLQQAQLGPVRGFAQEFGVDSDEGLASGALAKAGEHSGRRD